MQLRIGILRCELERQRKALAREMDMMQKERVQLVKKGNQIHHTIQVTRDLFFLGEKTSCEFKCIFFLYTVIHQWFISPHICNQATFSSKTVCQTECVVKLFILFFTDVTSCVFQYFGGPYRVPSAKMYFQI